MVQGEFSKQFSRLTNPNWVWSWINCKSRNSNCRWNDIRRLHHRRTFLLRVIDFPAKKTISRARRSDTRANYSSECFSFVSIRFIDFNSDFISLLLSWNCVVESEREKLPRETCDRQFGNSLDFWRNWKKKQIFVRERLCSNQSANVPETIKFIRFEVEIYFRPYSNKLLI